MKARDIRAALQGTVDPKIIFALCGLAETVTAQQQEINTMARMMNQLTDILMQLGVSIEGATNAVDELRKIRGIDES